MALACRWRSRPQHQLRTHAAQQTASLFDRLVGTAEQRQRNGTILMDDPLRPLVDRKVLEFVQSHTFHPADFTIRSDGVCRLNPEMARQLVKVIASLPHVVSEPFRLLN
jgi:hypothetical protein